MASEVHEDAAAVELPPQDLHAEQATLGGMLVEPGAATRALAAVSADDFYREAHRVIVEAIASVHEREEPVDLVTVSAELRRLEKLDAVGGPAYLTAVIRETPTAAHVVRYAKMVAEKAALRKLISAGADIRAIGYSNPEDVDAAIDEAERIIFDVAQRRIERDFVEIRPVVKAAFDVMDQRYHTGEAVTGIPTGVDVFDEMTAGLQRSDLIVIAGRPSMGKTSLAVNNIALHAATVMNVPVGIFSLEMSKEQLAEGLLCSLARVDSWRVRRAQRLRDEDWQRIGEAAGRLADSPIFIDDSPAISVLEMRAKARRLKSEHDVQCLILDYLQLARGERSPESRYQEISMIARALKGMARELAVPVVAVSQLSRAVERREDKRPILSDLAESGNIEAEADIVAFIYRPSYYERKRSVRGSQAGASAGAPADATAVSPGTDAEGDRAELIVAKHRGGPVGTVHISFLDKYRCFENEAPQYAGHEPAPADAP
ncbi:MAG: replicative DNA helicase [Armatimonadota bacterium]